MLDNKNYDEDDVERSLVVVVVDDDVDDIVDDLP